MITVCSAVYRSIALENQENTVKQHRSVHQRNRYLILKQQKNFTAHCEIKTNTSKQNLKIART